MDHTDPGYHPPQNPGCIFGAPRRSGCRCFHNILWVCSRWSFLFHMRHQIPSIRQTLPIVVKSSPLPSKKVYTEIESHHRCSHYNVLGLTIVDFACHHHLLYDQGMVLTLITSLGTKRPCRPPKEKKCWDPTQENRVDQSPAKGPYVLKPAVEVPIVKLDFGAGTNILLCVIQ
jgi:hypothetical protein